MTGLRLYNTLTRELEPFTPPPPYEVRMYNCGPTVYNYAHIGNLRAYVFADVLRRTLEANGYTVKQIVNITDVGHLVSDADEGEDRMEVGAKREGKSVEEITAMYSKAFFDDLKALNVETAEEYPRASKHIPEQIELIKTLEQKGFTYKTADGIYFDTSKFPQYADFARLDLAGQREGARVEANKDKRHPTDFALWKFSGSGSARLQEWESPWGVGFPGWHLECSAMSRKYLGQPFDIHTGGIDHIPVHHTNEIAQSVAAYGVPLARFWMHSGHVTVDGQKMSKSLGNTYTLTDLKSKGISPLAFRYWLLTASYRTQVNFTWEAVSAAADAYNNLRKKISRGNNRQQSENVVISPRVSEILKEDLNTSALIAYIWSLIQRQEYFGQAIADELKEADKVLGLDLLGYKPEEVFITPELQQLLDKRKIARDSKNFVESDRLRDEIKKLGYEVKDTSDGQQLEKLSE